MTLPASLAALMAFLAFLAGFGPTGVGASSRGAPFTILGSAGTSVRKLRLYRNNGNDGYLRGIVAVFTDGTEMRAGVRKDQFSELTLSEGEIITAATLWSFTPSGRKAKSSSARVGRIDITTDRRSWGYGVDNTAKLSSKAVNVGSGVLVGLQGSTGDDMDSVALIFLKTMSDSVVDDIVFEKPAGNNGLSLVTLKEGSAVRKDIDFSYTFSGTETRDASTTFSTGSSTGLSMKTTFHASLPQVLDSGIDAGVDVGSTRSFDRHNGRSAELSWSTTVALTADNPAVSCSAMVWMGKVEVAWHGTQTVTADGASISFPVSGTLTHVAYGKVETVCRPLAAPSSSSSASASSSSSSSSASSWYSSASSSYSAAKAAKTWAA
ncbi:hypothetical protein C8A01DRAFT_40511 [Parachaetomium inaequale]|uniref:Jacalin-type lectin domain-containing protein n=1 Tax=Parachaetomium inaequale TaxID=2588326 RepID=A0AAN6SMG1_9PEZI|nr:hypothetical protein C8A01DRAFT_40511 [Parachaetomium inaequale]